MAIFVFSILLLLGLAPAAFLLDRLFAINFETASSRRSGSEGLFWQPRGFAGTGEQTAGEVSRRPIANGIRWLFSAPENLRENSVSKLLLWGYRLCVLFSALILIAATAYFISF